MRPEHVVVINLDRRTDRWQTFVNRWTSVAPGVPVIRIPGVEADDATTGCWQAHRNALAAAPGPLLVLEDDACFTDDFSLELPDPPPGWQLLRLGGWLRAAVTLMRPWTPVERISHTHAYVAREPDLLAAHIAADTRRDVGMALQTGVNGHWRLSPATVGQAAGHSDISGIDTATDRMWN